MTGRGRGTHSRHQHDRQLTSAGVSSTVCRGNPHRRTANLPQRFMRTIDARQLQETLAHTTARSTPVKPDIQNSGYLMPPSRRKAEKAGTRIKNRGGRRRRADSRYNFQKTTGAMPLQAFPLRALEAGEGRGGCGGGWYEELDDLHTRRKGQVPQCT